MGGGEILLKSDSFDLNPIEEINSKLMDIFEKKVFIPDPKIPALLGFQTQNIKNYISNTVEGQIDTGKMMRSLILRCQALGAIILTGFHVEHLENSFSEWKVYGAKKTIHFKSRNLYICTNAFASDLLPNLDVKPGRGQVLITNPISGLKVKGIFHFDQGYYYFRNVGERVLFGGGRNLDFEGEATTKLELTEHIQNQLEHFLKTLILPLGKSYSIDQRWAGIMAFGKEKVPIVKDCENGMKIGCRMNGMGIAIGSEIGEQLASMPLN